LSLPGLLVLVLLLLLLVLLLLLLLLPVGWWCLCQTRSVELLPAARVVLGAAAGRAHGRVCKMVVVLLKMVMVVLQTGVCTR